MTYGTWHALRAPADSEDSQPRTYPRRSRRRAGSNQQNVPEPFPPPLTVSRSVASTSASGISQTDAMTCSTNPGVRGHSEPVRNDLRPQTAKRSGSVTVGIELVLTRNAKGAALEERFVVPAVVD